MVFHAARNIQKIPHPWSTEYKQNLYPIQQIIQVESN